VLEVVGLVVVVDEHLGEEPHVVVEAIGSIRDGLVFHFAWLLAHLHVLFFIDGRMLRKKVRMSRMKFGSPAREKRSIHTIHI
jgi:hypothetical protein